MNFTKLFNSILDSTIWQESKETKIVWVTMLAMCDRNGEVHASIPGLAARSGVTLSECEDALNCLMSPDHYSRTKDHEGRRIAEIDGGWVLLNHAKYRALLSAEERREYNRRKQQEHRAKKSMTVNDNKQCQHITEAEAEADTKETQKHSVAVAPRSVSEKTKSQVDQFEQFWSICPRKTAKGAARKAWLKAIKTATPEQIIEGMKLYAKQVAGTEPQFIAHPATWLNGERWLDDTSAPVKKPRLPDYNTPEGMAELKRLFAEGLHTP